MAVYTKKSLEEMRKQLTEDDARSTKPVRKTDRPYFTPRRRSDTPLPEGMTDPIQELMQEFSSRSATIVRKTKELEEAKNKNASLRSEIFDDEEVIDLSPRAEAAEVEEVTGKTPEGADKLLRDDKFMNQVSVMQDKYPNLTVNELINVIEGESTFDTTAVNPTTKAKGLFQITKDAAKEAGINYASLEKMSASDQLKEYDKYLERWGYDGSYSLGILQAAPSFRNESPNTVVYTESKNKRVFELNPQWFKDGVATVGSINNYYGY